MAGMGPPPKPAHLRQRTNKKAGMAQISAPEQAKVPPIPNPDKRDWHALTLTSWKHAWKSPMASQWIQTDIDALGRLALLWDAFYKQPDAKVMAEIRLQEQRFGLSPLDRSRLQWEIRRAEEGEKRQPAQPVRRTGTDPRAVLMAILSSGLVTCAGSQPSLTRKRVH
jgi:hypothetical protein